MARRRTALLLVTGGSGFLGRHLVNRAPSARWAIVAPSSASMDIRRRDSTIAAIKDWKPRAVVHLAYRPDDRSTIVDGSRNVADGAHAAGARLVHVSSDLVFRGRAAPYTERDEPSPLADYGRNKADAERAVASACPGAVIVRTSLLYGTDELAPWQHDIRRALVPGPEHQPFTFFTDEIRCPAHAGDVAGALTDLAGRRDVSGPLHVAGPDGVSRADLARTMARWMGLDPGGLVTGTIAEAGLVRPARIVLDTTLAASLGITCRPLAAALP